MSESDERGRSLRATDIVVARIGRRSALAALGTAALNLGHPASARAKATDSDANDRPGRGRTGHTDRDAGEGSDGVNRGVCAERRWSDADASDPQGRGRGPCH